MHHYTYISYNYLLITPGIRILLTGSDTTDRVKNLKSCCGAYAWYSFTSIVWDICNKYQLSNHLRYSHTWSWLNLEFEKWVLNIYDRFLNKSFIKINDFETLLTYIYWTKVISEFIFTFEYASMFHKSNIQILILNLPSITHNLYFCNNGWGKFDTTARELWYTGTLLFIC